jgi:hypothetical protein
VRLFYFIVRPFGWEVKRRTPKTETTVKEEELKVRSGAGGIPQDKGRLRLWRKVASFLAGANLLPLTRSISRGVAGVGVTGSWVTGSLSPLSYKIIYLIQQLFRTSTGFSSHDKPP